MSRMSEADEVVLDSSMSKTLHSGLRVLEVLSARGSAMTITEIADAVGVHRTVAHRFVRTLEAHRLLRRDRAKRFHLGTGLVPSPSRSSATCAPPRSPSSRSSPTR